MIELKSGAAIDGIVLRPYSSSMPPHDDKYEEVVELRSLFS